MYMTREGKEYKEMCHWEIKSQCKGGREEGAISVSIDFYFKDNKKRDLDNFNKCILDSCTGLLWDDDSQIQELTLRKFVDKADPRVELVINRQEVVINK
jgi:crossover junction endodeoxyribonuclease RusA